MFINLLLLLFFYLVEIDVPTWIERLGFPIFVCLALGFFAYQAWQFMKTFIETQQKTIESQAKSYQDSMTQQNNTFLTYLEKRDIEISDLFTKNTSAILNLTDAITSKNNVVSIRRNGVK